MDDTHDSTTEEAQPTVLVENVSIENKLVNDNHPEDKKDDADSNAEDDTEDAVDKKDDAEVDTDDAVEKKDDAEVDTDDAVEKKDDAEVDTDDAVEKKDDAEVDKEDVADSNAKVDKDDRTKDAEENETDEDQPIGLLDQPLVVEGKRSRSSVQRLSTAAVSSPLKKAYKGGDGVELGSVDFINAQIDKHLAAELKNMHSVLYGVPGKITTLKREIRKFNGFDFEKDSVEFKKRHSKLMKMTAAESKFIKTMLGLTLHGDSKKEALVDLVMTFLMSPEDQHKKVPSRKRKPVTSKKGSNPKKAKKSNVDATSSKSQESASESDASGHDTNSDGEGTKDEKNDEEPSPSEKTEITKTLEDTTIENTIRNMLDTLDLTQVSLKEMVHMVLKKFPDDGLTERIDWVKATIKNILKNQQ